MIGTTLSHYRITDRLGAGGMGEVFRATDTNLGRDVAIKVLPAAVAGDAERLARFRREAHLLATLDHTNIAAIHGLEEVDGKPFLVLELVEGEELAARLSRGAIPVDEAVPIARQIAAALEEAHEKGVIHRDLKPANVKLTTGGKVKVLDFGLAKAYAAESDHAAPDLTQSPTMSRQATEAGLLLGTAAYMSPEQARGRPVDKRADIWAFGVVLFEMLAGKRLFKGETVSDTLAAVLKEDPRWDSLPSETPASLRRLLRRCLERDPGERLRDIGDARLELLEQPAAALEAKQKPRWPRAVPWAIAAALAAAVIGLLAVPRREASRQVARLELGLPAGVDLYRVSTTAAGSVAVSPDGKLLALIGTQTGVRRVFVRRLDQFEATPLPAAEMPISISFSPDGRSIAVVQNDRSLKRVSLADGLATSLASGVDFQRAEWGPDDQVAFTRERTLWQIPASGGAPRQLTTLDEARGDLLHAWPLFVPQARAILFMCLTKSGSGAARVESLANGERRVLLEQASFPFYAPSGHLVFYRDGALLAAPFDAKRLTLTGPPVVVVPEGVGAPHAALSETGSFVYAATGATQRRLVWVSRQGTEQALNDTPRAYQNPRLSPDGRRVLVEVAAAMGDLWIQDHARGTFTRLTSGSGATFPIWTPDGKRVVFRTPSGLRWTNADTSGRVEAIPDTSVADFPQSVSPDGRTLVILRIAADSSGDILALSLDGAPEPRPIVSGPAYEGGAQLSPDGRFLVYASDESGRMEVYVRPFPGPDRKWQVSTEGATHPLWSRSGREIFYRSGHKMMAVEVSSGTEPTLSPPRLLFERDYSYGSAVTRANFDVSVDGQRFVMVKEEGSGGGRLNVVLNFIEELKQRVPTGR